MPQLPSSHDTILSPLITVFTKDLIVDPATRGVYDVQHIVQAAASSSSIDKARKFLIDVGAPEATAYGSYEELVVDPNVDIIYIATPHSHHFANTLLALNAGKNVICEKPLTVNAEQTRVLIRLAREKRLFLMEAVWTRFFPLSIAVREYVKAGRIGIVKRVIADLSLPQNPETHFPDSHRMVIHLIARLGMSRTDVNFPHLGQSRPGWWVPPRFGPLSSYLGIPDSLPPSTP